MACGIDDTKPSLRGEYDHDIEECRRVIANLRTRVADLEAALNKHGFHPPRLCAIGSGDPPCYYCEPALSDAGEGWLKGLPFDALVSAWVKAQPEMVAGIREGVKAMKEGRVTPWEDVERELFGEGKVGE